MPRGYHGCSTCRFFYRVFQAEPSIRCSDGYFDIYRHTKHFSLHIARVRPAVVECAVDTHDSPARHPRSLWANRDRSGIMVLLLLNFPRLVPVMVIISSSYRNYTAAAPAVLLRCRYRYRYFRRFLSTANSRRSSVCRTSDAREEGSTCFSIRGTTRGCRFKS